MARPGLSNRVGEKVVADKFILVRQKAVVAVMAQGNINDQIPLLHGPIPSLFSPEKHAIA
jgi:hypothetical protein